MAQYIDKDTLVAEIERRKDLVDDPIILDNDLIIGEKNAYIRLLSFINTIEVKEVDLEKEIDDYINKHFSECDDGVLISDANATELKLLDAASIARYFFELGLKAQKGD